MQFGDSGAVFGSVLEPSGSGQLCFSVTPLWLVPFLVPFLVAFLVGSLFGGILFGWFPLKGPPRVRKPSVCGVLGKEPIEPHAHPRVAELGFLV